MRKLLFILVLITTTTAFAIDTETCVKAFGTPQTFGTKTYCLSKQMLNWWSARSWCFSLGDGVDLIDLTESCPDYYRLGTCANLAVSGWPDFWTINLKDEAIVYVVNAFGIVSTRNRNHTYNIKALCH